jgi:hypothetical protein
VGGTASAPPTTLTPLHSCWNRHPLGH